MGKNVTRASTVVVILLWFTACAHQPRGSADASRGNPARADDRPTRLEFVAPPGANLFAFVGRKIDLREVYDVPVPGEMLLDNHFVARYRVLEIVYGNSPGPEVTFDVYDHYGTPAFAKFETVLLYLSRFKGKWFHEKYLFQPVYPTSNGRWASCGFPYKDIPKVHWHGVKDEPIEFEPPLTFPLAGLSSADIGRRFSYSYYKYESGLARCIRGNYPRELFRVMAEGVLRGRGVFASDGPPNLILLRQDCDRGQNRDGVVLIVTRASAVSSRAWA